MSKYKSCFNCDANFKVLQPEGNEEIFGKPQFCPFCGVDMESETHVSYFEEEETEE